jgi:hypothetical protein
VADDPDNNAAVITIDNDGNNVTIAIDFTEDDWDSVPSYTISATDLPFDGSRDLFVQVANEDSQIVNCGVVIDATGDIILSATTPFTGKALVSGGRDEEIIPSATESTYSLPNAAFRMNTNGTSATFANLAMVPLSDGWMGYQQIAGSSNQSTTWYISGCSLTSFLSSSKLIFRSHMTRFLPTTSPVSFLSLIHREILLAHMRNFSAMSIILSPLSNSARTFLRSISP